MKTPKYLYFWGKARPAEEQDLAWHPLAYHSLDVAASLSVLLRRNPSVTADLVRLFGLPAEQVTGLALFLAAGHDIGKFGAFQGKAPEIFSMLFPDKTPVAENAHHSEVGLTTLIQDLVSTWYPDEDPDFAEDFIEPLVNASCGHHGRPVTGAASLKGAARLAARDYLADCSALFNAGPALPLGGDKQEVQTLRTRYQQASWLLAGLINLADWVGSSQTFFPYSAPSLCLADYYALALSRAELAVEACSLFDKQASQKGGFDHLFGKGQSLATPGYKAKAPTPLQAWADSVDISAATGPGLFVLEDETGAGKTEAALTLASRLISAGLARGLFFCLPTQTTANAIFERTLPVAARFFDGEANPTLCLAHGNSKTALARILSGGDSTGVSVELKGWAQESRKTALLADFGVGTIDQAALSALPVKHVVLRQLGLARKVLVVDEAHACDTYLLDLLKNLVTQHTRLGGSTIILSATLPIAAKQALVDAYHLGLRGQARVALSNLAYPLATACLGHSVVEQPIANRAAARLLKFKAIQDHQVPGLIKAWVDNGLCVCLMRNTVASAQEAYAYYSALYPGKVQLAHARFALSHRVENDQALLGDFGKSSGPELRAGKLVISTQVAEQSLDVDFDEMISELAPIDSLLQRFGRRRRHLRDAFGAPAEREGRAASFCYVITPAAGDNSDFMKQLPGGTRYVYPMPGVLYRTATVVHEWAELEIPTAVRSAVEFCYDETQAVPAFLLEAEDAHVGAELAAQQAARVQKLKLEYGYSRKAEIQQADNSVTRLGEPSISITLCDEAGAPLFGEGPDSRVPVRQSLLSLLPDEQGDYLLRLRVAEPGRWTAQAADSRFKPIIVKYDRYTGLSIIRIK